MGLLRTLPIASQQWVAPGREGAPLPCPPALHAGESLDSALPNSSYKGTGSNIAWEDDATFGRVVSCDSVSWLAAGGRGRCIASRRLAEL